MSTYPYYDLPAGWEGDVLRGLQAPVTMGNIQLLDVWTGIERGWGTLSSYARFNPLNTTQTTPGSTDYNWNNGYPVQNYTDWASGLQATIATLENGRFGDLLREIRAGTIRPNSVVASPELATWSGGGYSSLNLAAYQTAVPSTRFHTGSSADNVPYLPGTSGSTPIVGGLQQWINSLGNTISGTGTVPVTGSTPVIGGVEGALGAAGSAISTAGGIGYGLETLFTWLGNQLFRWIIVILLVLAMLVVLDQLLSEGSGMQQVRKAFT